MKLIVEESEFISWRVGSFRRYLLFYEVLPDRLRLLRLLHGYRDLQSELQK
jgi:plasmid stabilization system protein ParE